MRKLLVYFIILGFVMPAYASDVEFEPIVLSIAQINNLDNQLSDSELNGFRTRLQIEIQEKKHFLTLIFSEYDSLLLRPLARGGEYITEKDLSALGQWKNEDYVMVVDLSKTRKVLSTYYRGTMRVFDIRTREIVGILDLSNKNIETVAAVLVAELFQRLWQGTLIITADNPPFFLTIDDNKIEVKTKRHETLLMRGEHKLIAGKSEYRTEVKTIDIEPGDREPWNITFIKRGAELRLDGSPKGARVLLESKGEEYRGKLPFEKTLPEGDYSLKITNPGFYSHEDKIIIKDGEDNPYRVELEPIPGGTIWKRSLLFAGLGQYYYGDKLKGFTLSALEAAGILAGGVFTYLYVVERKDRDNLFDDYRSGKTQNRSNIGSKEDWMKLYQAGAITAFVTAAAVYGYNVYDIYGYRRTQSKRRAERSLRRGQEAFEELDEEENNLKR